MNYDDGYAPDAYEVRVSELLVATPDRSDPLVDPSVRMVLRLLRDQQGMEAAFACEVIDGERVCRLAQPSSSHARFIDEQAEPLEAAFCAQALSARVPAGCHLSAPVVLADGMMYGTLYSFSFNPDAALETRDLKKLEMAAHLAARLINERVPRSAARPSQDDRAHRAAPVSSLARAPALAVA